MSASLTWLDHDTEERDRMHRILALFRERDTRDELGIGSIRDALADELFPGTSTIQTRLRYMLFVPWTYWQLEQKQVPARRFAKEARAAEISLVSALLASDDTAGVFGKRAGGGLDRLPSSVYWSGLGSWGLRRMDASQEQYHSLIDEIYACRKLREREEKHARIRGEGSDSVGSLSGVTWHPKLPPPPAGFPEELSTALTCEEAHFLQDQITTNHPDSLLAKLAYLPPSDAEYPWEHPRLAQFNREHRELLHHGRLLSELIRGAAILYNLMLAEVAQNESIIDEREAELKEWVGALDMPSLRDWSLAWVSPLAARRHIRVSPHTLDFCQAWLSLVADRPDDVNGTAARALVRNREIRLKGPRSRFTNPRARDQWSGTAGLIPLSYRWPTVRQFMQDLQQGLEASDD